MNGGNTGNGFDKDRKRASEAGKKGGKAKSIKTLLKDILNEECPASELESIKEKYGVAENITNGEAIVREIIRSAKKSGDTKALIDMLKITGEFNEKIEVDQNIIFLDEEDKGI